MIYKYNLYYLVSSQSELQEYYKDDTTCSITQTLSDDHFDDANDQKCACLQMQIVRENNIVRQQIKLTNVLDHAVVAVNAKIKCICNQQLQIIEQIVDAE
ncbi:Hypothetical_protein [Hexamita inflata]|uniref:Hypothetical_protein n=1 Tax=Hexamita inflata TaxID=28002 RepID=A0AA86N4T3_9EUKA|nr:Hypothetical protein HINF_LOCUS428 [Hexamita inflata]